MDQQWEQLLGPLPREYNSYVITSCFGSVEMMRQKEASCSDNQEVIMSHVDYGFSEKEQSYSQSSTFIDRTTSPSRISNVLKGIVIQNRRTRADYAAHSCW